MKNIYDIRKEEQLIYVLPVEMRKKNLSCKKNHVIKIIVYLYYLESVDRYMQYLFKIPENFSIEVYSSKEEVLSKVEYLLKKQKRQARVCLKKNTGRDISALLIAAKESCIDSDYICFLHDKKEHETYLTDDANRWIENLWENMIASENYILNIMDLFWDNAELGVLFPPEPIGEFTSHWYGDTWFQNYENTRQLGEKLNLSVDISEDKPVYGLGTVFWARTDSLKKLLEKEWKYDDFPAEPLPMDGTFNHAIERIIGYAAWDSGYKSGTVMTTKYASWLLLTAQEYARAMFSQLSKREHIFNIYQVKNLDSREKQLQEYVRGHKNNYIYGAGNFGKALYKFLADRNLEISGFVVTSLYKMGDKIGGVPVMGITTLTPDEEIGIIIGVSYETRGVIEDELRKLGFSDFIYGY